MSCTFFTSLHRISCSDSAPDYQKRNIFEVLKENPELARRAILMRKFGQEIIEATAGKKVHGTAAVPGGINRNLPIALRDRFLSQIDEMQDWAMDALALARDYILEHLEMVGDFADFPSPYLSLARSADGALDLYDGTLRVIDRDGTPSSTASPARTMPASCARTCARGPT
jgi:NAD-reducing hydrogenase large subunit